MSRRVSFSPEINEKPPTPFHNHGGGIKVGGNKRRVVIGIWSFRPIKDSSFSPAGFLRRIGAKVAREFRLMSTRRRSSRKVSSSSSSSLARSRSYAGSVIDSQRAEAIEDCIEFLNSSSSSYMQRSNSVSASSC
ncbi:hypothetical protein U1Q18_008527 [Sarracenia purpurea var. burkii]